MFKQGGDRSIFAFKGSPRGAPVRRRCLGNTCGINTGVGVGWRQVDLDLGLTLGFTLNQALPPQACYWWAVFSKNMGKLAFHIISLKGPQRLTLLVSQTPKLISCVIVRRGPSLRCCWC